KDQFGKLTMENTHTYEGPVDVDGAALEKILLQPTFKVEAEPNEKFKFDLKSAKGKGHVLFDNKTGRLIETMATQRMEVHFGQPDMIIQQKTEQTTTIRLQK